MKDEKQPISFRISADVYQVAQARSKQLGFPSMSAYFEALLQADQDREMNIQVTHTKDGAQYRMIEPESK